MCCFVSSTILSIVISRAQDKPLAKWIYSANHLHLRIVCEKVFHHEECIPRDDGRRLEVLKPSVKSHRVTINSSRPTQHVRLLESHNVTRLEPKKKEFLRSQAEKHILPHKPLLPVVSPNACKIYLA